MGGGGFKPPRLAAPHEVWSKHFQWSWESAYILRAKSSEMLCEKHI